MRTTTVLILLLILSVACRAEVVVDIDIDQTEGGLVTVSVVVNDEVLDWVPDWAEQVETSDLAAAGWEIEISPTGETLSVRKPFDSPDQLIAVLFEVDGLDGIAGSAGLFGEPELLVDYEGAVSRYSLSLLVNLEHDVADLIDPGTADLFGGNLFGVPIEELERRAGKDLNETVGLVVRASFPQGSTRLPEAGALALNEGGTRQLQLAGEFEDFVLAEAIESAEQIREEVTQRTVVLVLVWLALIAAVGSVVYLYVQSVRHRRKLADELPNKIWM